MYECLLMIGSLLEMELAEWGEYSSTIRVMKLDAADGNEARLKAQGRADRYNAVQRNASQRMKILAVL